MLRFALQIFLSAFLLFQVQPIVGRFVLPEFGGAANVWTVCLVFFQVFLLLGYWYAYLLDRWLTPFRQAIVHAILVFLAFLIFIPLNIESVALVPNIQSPQAGIIFLLLTSVGLPYALVSASGPLFQNWFRAKYPHKDPYRLYALSNVGSLLGLLSYPFIVEPVLSLHQQTLFWSTGFLLYFIWTLSCLWSLKGIDRDIVTYKSSKTYKLRTVDAIVWVCIAGIATTLLLATTNKITMDVASVPFLWILPLTLYLLSFIICFDKPTWYDRRLWISVLFIVSLLAAAALVRGANSSIHFQLTAYLTFLFVGCMVCHGELYRLRPHPKLLTQYYLLISLGGAMGGVFVALIAPLMFDDYHELPMSWIALFLIVGLCIFTTINLKRRYFDLGFQISWAVWIALFSGFLYSTTIADKQNVLQQSRSFYGVLKLFDYKLPEGHPSGADRYVSLMHGKITHGTEYYKDGIPLFLPTSYYASGSGIGLAIAAREVANANLNVGVVGMGAATISALCKMCRSISFYEIDPAIVEIERQWFSSLDSLRAGGVEGNVYLGDGRKVLAQQLENRARTRFDVLAIDAFSGDSIPVHLLTREALELYQEHLTADGILAVHISNRHLDLTPVLSSLALDLKLFAVKVIYNPVSDDLTFSSEWILLSGNHESVSDITSMDSTVSGSVISLVRSAGYSWTDEYSNLLSVLR